ncbi:hypothetical protein D3C75_664430 [compost metagenome]
MPWVYRCLIDGLFGVQGHEAGIRIRPQLPAHWQEASVKRTFRGAELHISMKREAGVTAAEVYVNGNLTEEGIIKGVEAGREYNVLVKLPLMEG